MTTSTRPAAIRVREWVDYYADRWQIHAPDLLSETYGKEILPTPKELRTRITQLHDIGVLLDKLLPLALQRLYWHIPWNDEKRPLASFLAVTHESCLDVVVEDLQCMSDAWHISEGIYQPGLKATNALLARLAANYGLGTASTDDTISLDEVTSNTAVLVSNPWENEWETWPDSRDVARTIGAGDNGTKAVERLRAKGKLLGVRHPTGQKLRYPPCQFDGARLLPSMEQILSLVPKGSGSGWLCVFWLYADNSLLGNQKPADLLISRPADVLDATRKIIQPSGYFGW